jgi:hypothetical protein
VKKKSLKPAKIIKEKNRLEKLMNQITKIGPLMRGTIVTNGQKHKQPYFSLNKDKRTYLIYLGERRLEAAREMTENYKKMIAIIEEVTVINMALLKNDAL